MMRFTWVLPAFFWLLSLGFGAHASDFELSISSSATPGLPGAISALSLPGQDFTSIQNSLSPLFGSVEEGFASMHARADSLKIPGIPPDRAHYFLGAFTETELMGSLHDPVVPEISAAMALVGGIQAGAAFTEPRTLVQVELESYFGVGSARTVDAVGTDFIGQITPQSSGLAVIAPSFRVSRVFQVGRSFELSPFLYGRYSFWNASSPDFHSVGRWMAGLDARYRSRVSFTLESRLGPEPLPIPILPLVWDAVHPQINSQPLPALIGLGGKVDSTFGNGWKALGRIGVFAGYPGGQLELGWKSVSLDLSTWGLEESSNYLGIQGRIYVASLGIAL